MALPTLNYSENLPPMKTSIPGVFAVNSAHIVKGNLNVNETIEIAEDALQRWLIPAIEKKSADESHSELTADGDTIKSTRTPENVG
jgi:hypothetical protein